MDKQMTTVQVNVNGEQAKRELETLSGYATTLKKRITEAYKAGDSKQVKELEGELRKTNTQMKIMRKQTVNINETMKNLSTAKPNELRSVMRAINRELNSSNVKRGSEDWNRLNSQLKRVKGEMAAIRKEGIASKSWMSRMNGNISRWGGTIMSTMAALVGLKMAISTMRKNAYAKEDKQAELQSLTGLDDKSIEWLTKQAEKMATTMDKSKMRVRQSSKEILDAYTIVGSAKPELLKSKEALNLVTQESIRLAVAAKMDVKGAAESATTALNQFSASADEAGRYVNVLAAGSKVGSSNVRSQAISIAKAGVAAADANLSIEETVGLIETLGYKAIKNEVAGTGLKKFLITLKTGADDTNPSVVGLGKALDNLNKKQLTSAEVKKKFGEEGYNVAKVLIDNTDLVKQYTAAVTGTNIAEEQAAINSKTREAARAQLSNQMEEMGNILINKLNPAIKTGNNLLLAFLRVLPSLIDFVKEYKRTLTTLAVAIAAVNLMQKKNIARRKLNVFWNRKLLKSLKALKVAARANIWGLLIVATVTLIAYFSDLNAKTKKLTASQEALNRIKKKANDEVSNEVDRIKTLNAIAHNNKIAIDERRKAIEELKAIVPGYNAQLSEEGVLIGDNTKLLGKYIKKLKAEMLLKAAKDELQELYKKQRNLEGKIKESERRRLKFLDTDKRTKEAYKEEDFKTKLAFSYKKWKKAVVEIEIDKRNFYEKELKATNKAINSVTKEVEDASKKEEETPAAKAKREAAEKAEADKKAAEERRKRWLANRAEYQKELEGKHAKYIASIKSRYAVGLITKSQYDKKKIASEETLYKKLRDMWKDDKKKYAQYQSKLLDITIKGTQKRTATQIKYFEKEAKAEQALLQHKYYTGELSEKAYAEAVFQSQYKLLQEKLKLYKEGSKEYTSILEQKKQLEVAHRLDQEKTYFDKLKELRRRYLKQNIEEFYAKQLEELEELHRKKLVSEEEYLLIKSGLQKAASKKFKVEGATEQEKLASLKTAYQNKLITKQEYLEQSEKIETDYRTRRQEAIQSMYSSMMAVVGSYHSYVQASNALETAKVERKYDKQIAAAKGNTKLQQRLEAKKQKEINALKSKNNKKAMKIEIAQAMASTAMAALNAYASTAKIPIVGPALAPVAAAMAVTAGMLQVATIKKQHAAEAQGYYHGGFTGSGDYRKEVGVVHANEFVANHQAVNNPNLLPTLQLIDSAQRNNTVGTLTAQDIAAVASNSGGTPGTTNVVATTNLPPEVVNLLVKNSLMMEKMSKQFEKDIVAKVVIDGDQGLDKQMKRYNRLNNNA